MKSSNMHRVERERLASLRSYCVLDTPAEEAFDDLAAIAAHVAGTPIALISLVDAERQWFKARVGLQASETARDISFCHHVVESGAQLVVEDASRDERFASNPLVVGPPHIAFYAGSPLTDVDGHTLGTLCVLDRRSRVLSSTQLETLMAVARQVTTQLVMRRTRRETEARSRLHTTVWRLSLDLLCTADNPEYFSRVSPRWTEVLGWSEEEMLNLPWMEWVHPDDVFRTSVCWKRLVEHVDTRSNFSNRFRHKNGSWRWLSWRASVDPISKTVFATARDVTGQREQKKQLEDAVDEAVAANRMKSVFLANMSHELRTPLNSVIGFANVLSAALQDREAMFARRIAANGRHLLELLNDILDVSRIEAGKLELTREPVAVLGVVREVLSQFEVSTPEVRLRFEGPPDWVHPLQADRRRIRQVLINLVGNAVKFTSQGEVVVRVLAQGRFVRKIEVSDTGAGIPEAQLETVFRAFEQVDTGHSRAHGGTGLGLSISRHLCRMHGYELVVQSELGVGSTFRIEIGGPDA